MKEKIKRYLPYAIILFWAALCAVSYFLMINGRGGEIVLGIAGILFVGVGVAATLLARRVLFPTLVTGLSVFAAFATILYADLGYWMLEGLILTLPFLLLVSAISSALFIIGAGPTMLVLRIRARLKPQEAAEVPCEAQKEAREPMEDPAVEEPSEDKEDKEEKNEAPAQPRSLFASLLPVFAVMVGYLLLNSLLLTKIYPIRLLLPLVSYAVYLFLGRWSRQRSGRSLIPTALFCALLLSYNIIFNVGSFITLIASSGIPADSVAEYLLLFGLRILFAPVIPAAGFWLGGYIDAILKRFRDHEPKDNESEAEKKTWGFYPKKISRVYVSFIVLIILICTILLIFNADTAFDSDAGSGYVPPSFLMVFYTIGVSFASVIAALVLKAVIPKTKLWALLLCALLLPYVQYGINMSLFSGPLKGTIEEGGMLYFIVNRDFNFDGYNDEWYRKEHNERTRTFGEGTNGDVIHRIRATATGKGSRLEQSFCSVWEHDREFHFDGGSGATISHLEFEVEFADEKYMSQIRIYRIDGKERTRITPEVVDSKTIRITLNEDECLRHVGKDGLYVKYEYELIGLSE